MPSILNNAKDFLLNTDYPFDKVLETHSGSFTAPARHGAFQPRRTEYTIPHSIGTWGLVNGTYSTDNATWLPFGIINADTTGSTPTFQTQEVTAYCTTSSVVVVCTNYLASSATIYFALQLLSRD